MHKEAVHLQQVLEYWAQQQPDRVLLFAPEPNLTLSYHQLLNEAQHLHAWFDQLKIARVTLGTFIEYSAIKMSQQLNSTKMHLISDFKNLMIILNYN